MQLIKLTSKQKKELSAILKREDVLEMKNWLVVKSSDNMKVFVNQKANVDVKVKIND